MPSSIERIEKLIALAGSANEHEARSAAFLACKLIREGGCRIVAAPTFEDPRRAFHDAWAAAATPAPRPRRPPPDTRPRRPVPCEVGRARRSGQCAVCGEPFEEGSDVATPTNADDSRLGTTHADCRSRWHVAVDA